MGEIALPIDRFPVPDEELVRIIVVTSLTISCILITAMAYSSAFCLISSQLLFIPIIYAAYFFPRRGLYIAAICSFAFQTIGYYHSYPDSLAMISVTSEAIFFIILAALITFFNERVRSGEVRYRAIFEHSQIGILLFDSATFAIRTSNTKFSGMLNYTPGQVNEKSFLDIFLTPREKSRFLERIEKEKTTSDFETRFATKDGGSCWVNLSWDHIDANTVSCSVMNINGRKIAEKLNNDNMMKYRQLTESSPTSILIIQNGFIRFANPSFVAFLGHTVAEITGKSLETFIDPGDRENLNEFMAQWSQKIPAAQTRELRFVTKSGEIRGAALFTTAIRHLENPATLINLVDISEKQRLEEKILQDNDRRRGIIITVAHELRTPLQPILGYLNLLISDPEGFGIVADTKKILERCLASVDRERQIINQMLDLSVLDSGKIKLKYSTFALAPMVRKVLDDGGFGTKADLTVDVGESVMITADADRMISILDSILSNAISYSKPPRKIGIIYRTGIDDRQHHIAIRDNGIGIAPSQLCSIFEPFQLADGVVLARKYERLGLSLSIAKKVVQMHGGDITVESVVNGGSTFTIHLPKEVQHDA
ncbi:PAS domain-containing sensor histidine kinase [Methanoregula sp.]|uniref:sensor histidine kinase n=1 Tax=Methanoregula sp. TaxID=2052170 RepID=UPI002369A64E|nr:PAS domain-containing sensor histidine kinase [Methanoregula sp.]MDD1686839.1 PAS domain-containing sensor histidine kinase [Methanoregula sp.]